MRRRIKFKDLDFSWLYRTQSNCFKNARKIYGWCKLHICISILKFYHCCWYLRQIGKHNKHTHVYIRVLEKAKMAARWTLYMFYFALLSRTWIISCSNTKKDKHRNRTRVSQVLILMPSLNIDHQIHRRANQHPYSCIQNELVPVNGRSPWWEWHSKIRVDKLNKFNTI